MRKPRPQGGPGWRVLGPVVIAFACLLIFMFFAARRPEDSALLAAVLKGDVAAARQALDKGASTAMPIQNGSTILHVAAKQGNVEMGKLLLERGARDLVHVRNGEGKFPLEIAIDHNHQAFADMLRAIAAANAPSEGNFKNSSP